MKTITKYGSPYKGEAAAIIEIDYRSLVFLGAIVGDQWRTDPAKAIERLIDRERLALANILADRTSANVVEDALKAIKDLREKSERLVTAHADLPMVEAGQ